MSGLNIFLDQSWGCSHTEHSDLAAKGIRVCLVTINDLQQLAKELAVLVNNTCWMTGLDRGTRRAYEQTVNETADILTKILEEEDGSSDLGEEFGEIMVSLGSGRALEIVFGHTSIPLAELWKPQKKQNEGFDFHTVCSTPLVNFGEAKYSGKKSPHGQALAQIDNFLVEKKHLRDRIHLQHMCPPKSLEHLDDDRFGVVASFSVNGKDPIKVLTNAATKALAVAKKHSIENIFLVGVARETN